MATVGRDIESIELSDSELWTDGVPHELFKQMRRECPVHWTAKLEEFPEEDGFWSVTTADDIFTVTRDFRTYSSELGGVTALTHAIPLELMRAMFIAMDPPRHDRVKALFQRGFTPKRIAAHEDEIRAIVGEGPRPARGPGDMRPGHRRGPAGRLTRDPQLHGHPGGGRCGVGEARQLGPGHGRRRPEPRAASRAWSKKTCPRCSSAVRR